MAVLSGVWSFVKRLPFLETVLARGGISEAKLDEKCMQRDQIGCHGITS